MSKNAPFEAGIKTALSLSCLYLLSTSFLVSCGSHNPSQPYADTLENRKKSGQLYLQYFDLMQEKKYAEAQKVIDELAKYDPGLGPKLKGEIYYDQGKYEEAEKQILEAIKRDPGNYAYWEYGAIYAYRLGHVKEAIERASEAISKRGAKGNPSTSYLIRAMAYHRQGQTQKAIEDLGECLKITPADVEAHYLKGVYLDEAGKPKEALTAFAEALRWDPSLQSAIKRRLAIYMRLGDKANAKKELSTSENQAKVKLRSSVKEWIPADLTTAQVKAIVQNPSAE